MKQKAERKARDEASDAAFARYLAEERKKDIEKQREDNNARHARSKFTLFSNIYIVLNYEIYSCCLTIRFNIHVVQAYIRRKF